MISFFNICHCFLVSAYLLYCTEVFETVLEKRTPFTMLLKGVPLISVLKMVLKRSFDYVAPSSPIDFHLGQNLAIVYDLHGFILIRLFGKLSCPVGRGGEGGVILYS